MGYRVKVVAKGPRVGTGAKGSYEYIGMDVDYNGQVSEKKFLNTAFKKYPNLKAEVDAVKVGDTIEITSVQDGAFKVVSKVLVVSDQEPTPASNATATRGDSTVKNDDYNIGQQVGNALTNAAATLGGKATVKQLEERAWDIVLAGNRLKERIKKGEHLGKVDEPPTVQDDIGYDEEDIPF